MPPKKSKAMAPRTVQAPPPPQASRAARPSRKKRSHSEVSSASEALEDSQTHVASSEGSASPTKRRRNVNASVEIPQMNTVQEDAREDTIVIPLAVELQSTEGAVENTRDELAASPSDDGTTPTNLPHSKQVHFGVDEDDEKFTANHKTPFPKMSIKRRFTLSPSVGPDSKRHTTSTYHRTSLPPSLSQEDSDPVTIVQEVQFAPLRAVLDERIRRRLRRSHLSAEQNDIEQEGKRSHTEIQELRASMAEKEERINELILDLETQRQFGIDVSDDTDAERHRVKAIEAELHTLRQEVANSKVSDYFGELDDDMMVLDSSQEGVSYPQSPVSNTSTSLVGHTIQNGHARDSTPSEANLSTAAFSTKQWDVERRRFEDSILALSQEANDSKTRLQILEIELKSLGFVGEGASSNAILQTIRHSFDRIRETFDVVLPDALSPDATNEQVLEVLIANVKEFANRLRVQDKELLEQSGLVSQLRAQVDGLIERLAASEIRQKRLEEQWKELDEGWDTKERDIQDLQDQLDEVEEERTTLQTELDEKKEQVNAVEVENGELQQSVSRLNDSLQKYRDEETKLQGLITRMEEEHRTSITKMNHEREASIQDLEAQLDEEVVKRSQAEKQSGDHQTTIVKLESQIELAVEKRVELLQQIEDINAELGAERDGREQAESAAQEKDAQVDDLESRVGALEEELEGLNLTLAELRALHETERSQREAAEAELDNQNEQIDQLDGKLHQMGIEANNLRQKMFEVQQQNTAKVTALEQAASERDEQYQDDIAQEVSRREAAEDASRVRDATILDLQTSLEDIEQRMTEVLAERDTQVAELEGEIIVKNGELARLRDDLRTTEDLLQNETANNRDRQEELEAAIATLKDTIADHEDTIKGLQREAAREVNLHNSEMDDRNVAIAELNHKVANMDAQITELNSDKAGLERRVEAEAEQMLQLQADKEDELDSLRETIRDKQGKILIVENKAREADRRWQDLLDDRNQQIDELRLSNTTRTQNITVLNGKLESLKAKFANYIRVSQARMRNARDAVGVAERVIREEDENLDDEAARELDDLEHFQEEVEVQESSSSTIQNKVLKKVKGRGKKRKFDSGFGAASDEVENDAIAA